MGLKNRICSKINFDLDKYFGLVKFPISHTFNIFTCILLKDFIHLKFTTNEMNYCTVKRITNQKSSRVEYQIRDFYFPKGLFLIEMDFYEFSVLCSKTPYYLSKQSRTHLYSNFTHSTYILFL